MRPEGLAEPGIRCPSDHSFDPPGADPLSVATDPKPVVLAPLKQLLAFNLQIAIRRVEACVTELLAVDACLEQMDRCGVAQRMRMDPFACQCRGRGSAGGNVLLQEISNAEFLLIAGIDTAQVGVS